VRLFKVTADKRNIEMVRLDAVCVLAQATAATGEAYAVKLAGIMHPTLSVGVLASVVADMKLSEVKKPEDFSSKGLALGILHSMRFVDPHPVAKL
jgi:hypothetical protein